MHQWRKRRIIANKQNVYTIGCEPFNMTLLNQLPSAKTMTSTLSGDSMK